MKSAIIGQGRLPGTITCPKCGKALDGFTGARMMPSNRTDEVRPHAGDLTVCSGCAGILAFADDGALRRATESEIAQLDANPDRSAVMRGFQRMVLKRLMSPERVLN